MPDSTPTREAHTTSTSSKAASTDQCKNCGELRGHASEGVYDHTSWDLEGVNAGDPKWTQDYCWKCGAKY